MSTQGPQGCKELCEDPASLRLAGWPWSHWLALVPLFSPTSRIKAPGSSPCSRRISAGLATRKLAGRADAPTARVWEEW